MTLIAGIFSRREHSAIPEAWCLELRTLISRSPIDEVQDHKTDRAYFVKVDIAAFESDGYIKSSDGSISLSVGEPLLARIEHPYSWVQRRADFELIHKSCTSGEWSCLRTSQGGYSTVVYTPQNHLTLIADKLCLRPLYFWASDDLVVFASALRILEGLSCVPKVIDLQGFGELVGLGAPLDDRTPYLGIYLMRAAEIVQFNSNTSSRWQYWRWDDIETHQKTFQSTRDELYRTFDVAVARRNRDDRATVAYLSGGLDSRCVVAALRKRDVLTHTFNFCRLNTQDQVFGGQFAKEIGSIHTEILRDSADRVPDYSNLLANAWAQSVHRLDFPAERPQLAWSGEGGSVVLGHVHMSETIVDLMRGGNVDGAVEAYLRQEGAAIPRRAFDKLLQPKLVNLLANGIKAELGRIHCSDPGRAFHLFLLLNDQRRKLFLHFENIDLHRIEFQLPFFDSAFVESVVAAPVDWCLGHKLYVSWLDCFQPAITSVPWQSYPGHQSCPIPVSSGAKYQWDANYQSSEGASRKWNFILQMVKILRSKDFPNRILNARNLSLATFLHALGWQDYEYMIEAAQTCYSYSIKCTGQFNLPSE